MLVGLFHAFKDEIALSKCKDVFIDLESLCMHFSSAYVKDGDAKDAAIDAVCEYLQTLKTKATNAQKAS